MIFVADIHARNTIPRARQDDFLQAMHTKLCFILEQARQSPPLITSGDLLDRAKSDPWLEQYLIGLFRHYGVEVLTVPGQHELPEHSLGQYENSSLRVLEAAGAVTVLTKERGPLIHVNGWAYWGCAWGEEPDETMMDHKHQNMLIWHHMVAQEPLWPGQEPDKPAALLRKYPWFDLICTGDNHQTFVQFDGYGIPMQGEPLIAKGRALINPGSILRLTAAQVDHRPSIFRYENGKLEQIFLPAEPDVLDLTELDETKERDSRIAAFVERLNIQHEVGLDFQANLTEFLRANKVKPEVEKIIWRCVG